LESFAVFLRTKWLLVGNELTVIWRFVYLAFVTKRFLTLFFAIGLATACACKLSRLPRASRLQEHLPRQNIARTRKLRRRHHQAKPLHRLRLLRSPRLHRQPSAVAKKRRLAQPLVRLHRLHLPLRPQLRPKQKVLAKKRRQQRVPHRRLPNSLLAICSSRKVLRQPVRQPRLAPPQRAEAPRQQLIRLHPAEGTVWCG
jgi:hypothetical protein